MSQSEVTVGQYRVCVDAGVCTAPRCNFPATPDWTENHPVRCVTWHEAKAFAGFADARLPSEAEWEYAARSGGQNITYPWGDEAPDCTRLNFYDVNIGDYCVGTTTPVCTYPTGNTAQGLCDMSGNVWEWVEDNYAGGYRVTRGGSYGDNADGVRAAYRLGIDPSDVYDNYGFRLARSAP